MDARSYTIDEYLLWRAEQERLRVEEEERDRICKEAVANYNKWEARSLVRRALHKHRVDGGTPETLMLSKREANELRALGYAWHPGTKGPGEPETLMRPRPAGAPAVDGFFERVKARIVKSWTDMDV